MEVAPDRLEVGLNKRLEVFAGTGLFGMYCVVCILFLKENVQQVPVTLYYKTVI